MKYSILLPLFSRTFHAQIQTGIASVYNVKFEGTHTAGGNYKQGMLTAAHNSLHKSLPFGAQIRVTNRAKKTVDAVINDRGLYI